ncbi:acyl--CoA ligase [Endozoicomonas sp. Mp262]|uniref:class I adenylate-forming enzyme family protein n=1 Tax=Endozoicomonas sp. Mp262 TaxID=2919499 RepID=UPI0021D80B83
MNAFDKVSALIDAAAKKKGVALRVGNAHYSYQWIDERVTRLCSALLAMPKKPSRVFCQLPNGWEALVCTLACLRVGIEVVPIPFYHSRTDIDKLHCSLVPDASISGKLNKKTGEYAVLFHCFYEEKIYPLDSLIADGSRTYELSPEESPHPLTLFTSGTTGTPKGVQFSADALIFNLLCWRDLLDLSSNSVLFTEQGCLLMLSSYFFGGELILPDNSHKHPVEDIEKSGCHYLTLIERHEPTACFMMPAGFMRIADALRNKQAGYSFIRKTKIWMTGGASLPRWVISVFREVTGSPILSGYGLTEIPLVASSSDALCLDNATGVGKPLKGIEVHIETAASGGVGEIWVKSPGACSGYITEGVVTPIAADFFATGDLGYFDDQGRLFIVGRKRQLLKNAEGKFVGLSEMEAMVDQHLAPNCGTIIFDQPSDNVQRPWCLVIVDKDQSLRKTRKLEVEVIPQLIQCIGSTFPELSQVGEYRYISGFPLNPAGKIDRYALVQEIFGFAGG